MVSNELTSTKLDKKLLIVVPYRNRQKHLDIFLTHIKNFFLKDETNNVLEIKIIVIEQSEKKKFNLGIINNIGFLLEEKYLDYICINNVDFLPVSADYSYADAPTSLISEGFDKHPVDPENDDPDLKNRIINSPKQPFHGSIFIPKEIFRRVNGYSNRYWGWVFEDLDMKMRLDINKILINYRMGVYIPLLHKNLGFSLEKTYSEQTKSFEVKIVHTFDFINNKKIFKEFWFNEKNDKDLTKDGYNQTQYKILEKEIYFNIVRNNKKNFSCQRIKVEILNIE
jgi:hypothetical protein